MVEGHQRFKKAMIYAISEQQVYLFLFDTVENLPCVRDDFFLSVEDAKEAALELYGIGEAEGGLQSFLNR